MSRLCLLGVAALRVAGARSPLSRLWILDGRLTDCARQLPHQGVDGKADRQPPKQVQCPMTFMPSSRLYGPVPIASLSMSDSRNAS